MATQAASKCAFGQYDWNDHL